MRERGTISAFRTRNFAVAVHSFEQTLQTAFLSLVIIGEPLPTVAWVAIALSVVGVAAMTRPTGWHGLRRGSPSSPGGAATAWLGPVVRAVCNLHTLSIMTLPGTDTLTRSLVILSLTTSLQLLFLGSFLLVREPGGFAAFVRAWRVALVVGLTSVAGSAGWFTAMTLQKAAYVQVVGERNRSLNSCIAPDLPPRVSTRRSSRRPSVRDGLVLLLLWGGT